MNENIVNLKSFREAKTKRMKKSFESLHELQDITYTLLESLKEKRGRKKQKAYLKK